MNKKEKASAFTLIELLVVIGLIGVLAAGLGLALSGSGNRAAALQSGQSTINSLLSGTRAQAALSQDEARLFINVTAPSAAVGIPDGFLREFRIARKDGSNWVVTGDGVFLPKGTAFVPPSTFTTGVSFEPAESDWNSSTEPRTSDAFGSSSITLRNLGGADIPGAFREVKTFTPRGTVNNSTVSGLRIVIAPTDVNNDAAVPVLVFKNPEFVRGARISNYGVAALVNEAAGFGN